jgi:hypothetical protein
LIERRTELTNSQNPQNLRNLIERRTELTNSQTQTMSALNIALCDDVMMIIGKQVETRRAFSSVLKGVETGYGVLEPHHERNLKQFVNQMTGQVVVLDVHENFWDDASPTDIGGSNRNFYELTPEEYEESLLIKWSQYYEWRDVYEEIDESGDEEGFEWGSANRLLAAVLRAGGW